MRRLEISCARERVQQRNRRAHAANAKFFVYQVRRRLWFGHGEGTNLDLEPTTHTHELETHTHTHTHTNYIRCVVCIYIHMYICGI